jgi:rare lipoprotein A
VGWWLALAMGLGLLAGCTTRAARPLPGTRPESPTVGTARPELPEKGSRAYLGEGLASYYGPGLNGRKTASGERFDANALTAAHRTVAFGSCLRVVNMENGKSVQVRVNDRGPFKEERIIDVSLAAARKLDMLAKGLVRVRLYRCQDEGPVTSFSLPPESLPG